jgi:rhodanese-related sulfurtransferase
LFREHFPGTGDQRRFTGARRQQGKFDVRSPALFAAGHILGATNLPHRMISETTLAPYPKDRLVVVYCAGPHCNGANRAAVRLAELGRPVKEMIGGITGWQDEGFELAHI